jgi:MFS family permease
LTYSDILMIGGWGLVEPIFAVFVTEQIHGGSVQLVGLSAAVYFITKSFLQIPIARHLDKRRGERDDFWALVAGSLLVCISSSFYIWISEPWQIIVAQALQGIGGALACPAWLAIFTRHIDRNQEGLEWSLYDTSTDLGAALTAAVGGFLATFLGYRYLFALVTISLLAGTLFLTGIANDLKKKG